MNEMTGGDWVSLVIALGAIAGFIYWQRSSKKKSSGFGAVDKKADRPPTHEK